MSRRLTNIGAVLLLLGAAAGGIYVWLQQRNERVPAGITSANGRIEADEIDITPKFAGRIAALLVEEGDMVKAG